MPRTFYVYIMANFTGSTIYIGMTNDIAQRVREHKMGLIEGFTKKYRCKKLIYYETTQYVRDALAREKQLKGWRRSKKEVLINSVNPKWEDLAIKWDADLSFR